MIHEILRRGVVIAVLLSAAACGGGTRDVSPADVANLALFLASSMSDYITGQVICVDGGLTR